ncbi:tyrosine-type recombinase/integrase [Saezia sanguinis]|uniref:tyrosine-type recombinase/integrase n=1 Tax=Saezia sanguinis TaxID=1965230 RepID=UPI00304B9B44
MALSELRVKNAQPKKKPYTLTDGGGLGLYVTPKGSKAWHFRYYFQNKQFRISLGTYPAVGLKDARLLRQDAQTQLAKGIDPQEERKALRQQESPTPNQLTFAEFAQQWQIFRIKKLGHDQSTHRQSTVVQIGRYMQKDFLPAMGDMALGDITRADVLKVIRGIESRGALSMSVKCRGWLNELFRHALAEGLINSNPVADLDIVTLPALPAQHNPFLKTSELPGFLAVLAHYPGYEQTRLGIKLLFLTGVRTGELRYAEPEHFDLQNKIWRIPPQLVKQLQRKVRTSNSNIPPYLVPLPDQAVAIVQRLLECRFPWQKYLLCHQFEPKKIISENTLNYGIRRMGYKDRLTGHGIRATISTALNEMGFNKDWIEAQLSHSDKDTIRGAYNHAEYIEQRAVMMQQWADQLDLWEAEGLQTQQCQRVA